MLWLVDSVTLQTFGTIEALSTLVSFLDPKQPSAWTVGVRDEVLAGIEHEGCQEVLRCAELGAPLQVPDSLTMSVHTARVALGGTALDKLHQGEAECLVLATEYGGGVITDDSAAYAMIRRRGRPPVLDTVEVLRELVRSEQIDAYTAKRLVDALKGAGRNLRRGYPSTFTVNDFMPR